MRVAHLGPTTLPIGHDRGGAVQRRISELARAQAKSGDDVLIVSAASASSERNQMGVRYHEVKCRTRRPARDLEYLTRSVPALRQFRPDVIHFHAAPLGALITRKILSTKVLTFDFFEFRGSHNNLGKVLYRKCLAEFDRLLAVSEYCRRAFSAFWEIPPSRVDVVYNGVNTEQFQPDAQKAAEVRRRLGLTGGSVLLYVGRVCSQKGTDLLLDAWTALREYSAGLELVVAGPPEQFGNTQPNVISARITREGGRYLGAIDDGCLAGLYNGCDMFIMPTRQAEMFGMAALEAQACGKPVVSSRLGGLVEALSDRSALFFEPNDLGGLTQAIIRLLDDNELRARLAAHAVPWSRRFSWTLIADRLRTVYAAGRAYP